MRGCDNIRRMLDAFVDDALAPQEAALVARHLEHCDTCAARVARLKRLNAVARNEPPAVCEEDWGEVWHSIAREIRQGQQAPRGFCLLPRSSDEGAARIARLKRLDEVARNEPPPVSGEDWDAVWRSVAREIRRPQRAPRAFRLLRQSPARWAAAAAVLVLATVGFVAYLALPGGEVWTPGGLVQLAYGDELELGDVEVFDPGYTCVYVMTDTPETTILCFVETQDDAEGDSTEG